MTEKQLLIIAFVWPEPNSTAAGSRMMQLLHYFLENDYQITVASTASTSKLSADLKALAIKTETIQLNCSSFDVFIEKLQPELVLFDRFLTEEQFGWRIAEFAPNTIRILDTEDLHSLRNTREKAFKASIAFTIELWLKNDLTKREIASIYRCDLALIISSYEMHLLQEVVKIPKDLLLHLPFMLDKITKKQFETWPQFEQRKDFICIGNGRHAPNIDAIVWLKKEIWPLIRRTLPQVNLNIYGAYLPEHIKQMHQPKEGFLVHGWAKDKQTVFENARINLAPLRFGAGIKGKLIDAMQFGTASVTTGIGAEGMHENLDWNGKIYNDSISFANAAIGLYQNKIEWEACQPKGIAIINTLYNKTKLRQALNSKIKEINNNLPEHRTNNFIGTMLQHQTMASTKYMSKWITEKNK